MAEKPVMNGADNRLEKLEETLAFVISNFQRAEAALDPNRVQEGLDKLAEVREELRAMMGKIIDLRTLAHPSNWRLRMQYDTPLYCEFLSSADEQILTLALRDCSEETLDKMKRALERVDGESDD